MNVRVTRTIVIATAFTMMAAVFVDSASAHLFGRSRRNANRCCAPVTTCCSDQHYHGGTAYGMYQPGYANANHNCCGAANVVTLGNTTQGYSPQGYIQGQTGSSATFGAPGYSSMQMQQNSSQNAAFLNQGSTQTSSQNSFGVNQNGAIRSNSDLNPDGSLRGNTDPNNKEGTSRSGSDLNLDSPIKGSSSDTIEKSTGDQIPDESQHQKIQK